jgi:S1-C subfamily serine protease
MRIRLFWIVVALVVVPMSVGRAIEGNLPSDETADAVLIERLSSSVVLVENDTNDRYLTGTLVAGAEPRVVTNYHLLSSTGDAVRVYMNAPDDRLVSFRCRLIKGDPALDLALFAIDLGGKSMSSNNKPVPRAPFAAEKRLQRGVPVCFLGFPLHYGIGTDIPVHRITKIPVYRAGTIATEVFNSEFLIDAMVSSGNSGSAVFIRTARGTEQSEVFLFAGILKEFQHDTIEVKNPGGRTMALPHNTGLGVVIPAPVIEKFIYGD